jgi:hypothetical protein
MRPAVIHRSNSRAVEARMAEMLPCGPIRFLLRFAKPSFRTFVAIRLHANQIGNAPLICKPV